MNLSLNLSLSDLTSVYASRASRNRPDKTSVAVTAAPPGRRIGSARPKACDASTDTKDINPSLRSFSLPTGRQPLGKRLWQGAFALGLFLVLLVIGNSVCDPAKALNSHMVGHDFLAFYTGGHFVRTGQLDQIYNMEAVRVFQHRVSEDIGLNLGDSFGPFWNPPFYTWVFVPLSALPYRWALGVWTSFSLAALAGALVLLVRMLPRRIGPLEERALTWRQWALVPALLLVCMPFIQTLTHGQNTFSSLLLLTLALTAWRAGRALQAGLVAGLLFYKPQLGAVLAVMLVLNLGWRAMLGLVLTGSALLLFNVLTLPGTLIDYLHRLPLNVHWMQVEHVYLWERHATFKAFWRLLLQGRGPGEASVAVRLLTAACDCALGGGLLAAGVRFRNCTGLRRDRLIAATIAAMPLLMPFYFDYDLLLLAVPAVLLGGELLRRDAATPLGGADRWLVRAWMVLFVWMMFNPGIAGRTHVNVNVLLVTSIAGLLVHRAFRREGASSVQLRPADEPVLHIAA